ncbi:MAG TPA: D-alanyl-D-alanine carboxypeptidase/D-alanyl-D-alanine-endopeptidase [Thermoleophilaceae bacterium]|nr:D-alanyl-D-alanine carboxypeptidase/D-alanyl-D-alanine-endopeptidase [Thermoleophilaceae bacterium]
MRRLALILAAAAAAATPAPALAAEDHPRLERELRSLARGLGPQSGVLVLDATDRDVLFRHREGRRRIIASNAKLWTTAALLARLGPAGSFETSVVGTGEKLADGSWDGNLYLVGGGDPAFGDRSGFGRSLGSPATVEALAEMLEEAAGIVSVTGAVMGDESRFDSHRGGPSSGFGPSPDHNPLSALAFNGSSSLGGVSPPVRAARALDSALERLGVRVRGRARASRAPSGATVLATVRSLPVARLIRTTNKHSSNFFAEMLLKGLSAADGDQGTTSDGAAEARRFVRLLGARPLIADGSGLSRSNLATPRDLVELLDEMRDRPEFREFYASLSIAGVDGTLALGGHRGLRRGSARRRCRGKTGTLRDVSALSGYCRTRSGDTIVFSILSNRVSPDSAKRVEDRMLQAIARYG